MRPPQGADHAGEPRQSTVPAQPVRPDQPGRHRRGARLAPLSGQVAWDTQGRPVGLGDHEAQAVQIALNLNAVLAAVGATRNDIITETVYVVDYTPELLSAIFGPLRSGISAAPASTLLSVSALFAPEYLLEVQVVAALPGPGSPGRTTPTDNTAANTAGR
ncbi:RidA family protein [Streptomyces rubiginosohelvolus]|uniref:RidA family protein n=1 Tax=Streptomyces rubiginosohelvolus TaxID=67362 RepID=UPI0037B85049